MKAFRLGTMAAAVAATLGGATAANALTINLVDIGGVSQGTLAYQGFSAAARYWESVITDNVTLNFHVAYTSENFDPTTLGDASSVSSTRAKGIWSTAITADATTALDQSVIANLVTPNSANVRLNSSLQKALGIFTGDPNARDATIRFNSARNFDFDTRDGFQSVASDFVSVAVHEMGHAMGFTSAVGRNTTNNSTPSNTDLFRFKNGAWDISWGGDPYFSIDGGRTNYLGNSFFSAGPDGFQTSHWREGRRQHDGVSCTVLLEPQIGIHDPTGGLCQEGIVTANDLAIMDAMGWNLAFDILQVPGYAKTTSQIMWDFMAVPEASTWAMMIAGFGMAGAGMRRSRRKTTVSFA